MRPDDQENLSVLEATALLILSSANVKAWIAARICLHEKLKPASFLPDFFFYQ